MNCLLGSSNNNNTSVVSGLIWPKCLGVARNCLPNSISTLLLIRVLCLSVQVCSTNMSVVSLCGSELSTGLY